MSVEAVLGGLHRSIEAHASSGEFAVERSPDQLLLACNRLVETVIEVRCRPRTGLRADVYDEVTITSVLREVLPKISPHSLSNLNARARLCSIAQSEGGVLWAQSCFAWEEKSVGFVRSLPVRVIASRQSVLQESRRYIASHRNPALAVCSDEDRSSTLETSSRPVISLSEQLAQRYGHCDAGDGFLTVDLGESSLPLGRRRQVAERMVLIDKKTLAGGEYVGCNVVWMLRGLSYQDEDCLWVLANRLNDQERKGGVSSLGVFAWSYHGGNLCLGTHYPMARDWDRVILLLLEEAMRRVRVESDVLH